MENPKVTSGAMTSSEHLKRWLTESGRRFMVLDSCDLVDGMVLVHDWPRGAELIQEMVTAYRLSRGGVGGETLSVDELDAAIRQLVSEITARDPNWRL